MVENKTEKKLETELETVMTGAYRDCRLYLALTWTRWEYTGTHRGTNGIVLCYVHGDVPGLGLPRT